MIGSGQLIKQIGGKDMKEAGSAIATMKTILMRKKKKNRDAAKALNTKLKHCNYEPMHKILPITTNLNNPETRQTY